MATVISIFPKPIAQKYDLPPQYNAEERKHFGYIPSSVQSAIDELRSAHGKLGFIMQYYYFRETGRFYSVESYHVKDRKALARRYELEDSNLADYGSSMVAEHRDLIFELSGFQKKSASTRLLLQEKADELTQKELRPRQIFGQLVAYLFENKMEGLNYYPLAKIITQSLNRHEKTLVKKLDHLLSEPQKKSLDALIDPEQKNKEGTYLLTSLATYNQSTTPSKIKDNCALLKQLQTLKKSLEPAMQGLSLSWETIDYYARLALSFDIHQLSRRDEKRYLYLLSFVIHQTFFLQDILVETFLSVCQSRKNRWIRVEKEQVYEAFQKGKSTITILSQTLQSQTTLLKTIFDIADDTALNDSQKVGAIQSKKRDASPQESTVAVEYEVEKALPTKSYAVEEEDATFLQNRLKNILLLLSLDTKTSDEQLVKAIAYFQEKEGVIGKKAPLEFLSTEEQQAIKSDGDFRKSLYKIFLFLAVMKGIKSGTINLKDSYKFRSFESYLIPLERWQKAQNELLKKAQLTHILSPKELLKNLEETLDRQVLKTHTAIESGTNIWASYDAKETVILKKTPPKENEMDANSLLEYFPQQVETTLFEILSTINQKSSFLNSFEHEHKKHSPKKASETALLAGIVGYGCNLGIPRMGQMIQSISREEVEYATQKQFSVTNLERANTAVLHLMEQIPTAFLYKNDPTQTHTSSDGQKVAVGVDSLSASYSYKYFGTQKGVSIYSFIDESHRLFHSTVITPSEREAAYVIDGLMANEVVESTIHSTDTHGYSELIFAVTHLLGISFAPRIKGLKHQQLYGFTTPSQANKEAQKLLKGGRIKTELIEEQWENILRLIATIKLKEATASQLFKRLSSYSQQHPLYRALKQFGRIIKSIFLLKYIDDIHFRQSIEKQLNKTESYHSFAKAIAFAQNHELNYATREEQLIAEGSKRLIANAIICWNYLYITKKYLQATTTEDKEKIVQAIKNGSMVLWQHINFHGVYDFSDAMLKNAIEFNLEEILEVQFT